MFWLRGGHISGMKIFKGLFGIAVTNCCAVRKNAGKRSAVVEIK